MDSHIVQCNAICFRVRCGAWCAAKETQGIIQQAQQHRPRPLSEENTFSLWAGFGKSKFFDFNEGFRNPSHGTPLPSPALVIRKCHFHPKKHSFWGNFEWHRMMGLTPLPLLVGNISSERGLQVINPDSPSMILGNWIGWPGWHTKLLPYTNFY